MGILMPLALHTQLTTQRLYQIHSIQKKVFSESLG